MLPGDFLPFAPSNTKVTKVISLLNQKRNLITNLIGFRKIYSLVTIETNVLLAVIL